MSITQVDHHSPCDVLLINCHVSVVLLIRNHHQLPNECTKQSKIKKTIVKSSTCHWNVTPGNAITYHPPKKFKKQKKNKKNKKQKKKLKNWKTHGKRERGERKRGDLLERTEGFTQTALLLSDQIGQSLPPSMFID